MLSGVDQMVEGHGSASDSAAVIAEPLSCPESVHVWHIDLGDIPVSPRTGPPLAPDEAARARRFRFEHDRLAYLVSRTALRTLISRYLGTEPEAIQFRAGPYGKPLLGGPYADHPLRFNVSHAENVVLICIAVGREVGVDIEFLGREIPATELAQRFFSPVELLCILRSHPLVRKQVFLSYWTRKEAFLKARGDGLAIPMNEFDVISDSGEPGLHTYWDPDEAASWSLVDLEVKTGYVGALATAGTHWRVVPELWEW